MRRLSFVLFELHSSSLNKTVCKIGLQVFSLLLYDLVGDEGYRCKRRKKARTEISLDLVLLLRSLLCTEKDEKDRKLKKTIYPTNLTIYLLSQMPRALV